VPLDFAPLEEQAAACLRVDLQPLREDCVLNHHAGERGSRDNPPTSQERRRRSGGVTATLSRRLPIGTASGPSS